MAAYKTTKYSASFGKLVIALIALASNGEASLYVGIETSLPVPVGNMVTAASCT